MQPVKIRNEYESVLKDMNNLAHILRDNKVRRGYIDFDLDEAKIIVDENKNVIGVEKRIREDGENVLVSIFTKSHNKLKKE